MVPARRSVSVVEMRGLILAGSSSEEDDLAYRLQGRSRYAMPLANRILVRYAAEALVASGVSTVAVAVSPSTLDEVGELLGDGKRFGARFRYLELPESATAADALRAARRELGDHPLVVHQGDALVAGGLRGPVGEFARNEPDVLLMSEPSHSYPEAVLAGVRGTPRRDDPLNGLDHVAPAALVSARVLAELDEFQAETSTIGGTMAALAEAGIRVAGRALEGCWCYSADCDHLLEANRMILDRLTHTPPEMELDGVRIEGRVAIHPTARIARTTIRGPAVIGGGAEISDTFIGPYSSIGPDARLEGAEVEHSIILAGACIRHVGHRIEASVIGAEAEIDHDFGVPSAVRLQVGRRSSVTLL
jgi:glucose-1-phosphate thymidylyltransferase